MPRQIAGAILAVLFGAVAVEARQPDPRVGIGLELWIDSRTGLPFVVTPYKDGPAFKAGIQAGDRIQTIRLDPDNSKNPLDPGDIISTRGMTLEQVNDKLRGLPGRRFVLIVQREGQPAPLVVKIANGRCQVETICGVIRKPDASFDHMLDRKAGIGYIRVRWFGRDTATDIEKLLGQVKKDRMKGLVLDLRFNEGGILSTMRDLADLFVAAGPILSIRNREGKEEILPATKRKKYLDLPIAVLVNGDTMSSGEALAACLQDHKRAVIVGERTRGNGGIRNRCPFAGGDLKLTTWLFVRPSGKTWHRFHKAMDDGEDWGIRPNRGYEVALDPRDRDELQDHLDRQRIIPPVGRPRPASSFQDVQLERALEVVRSRIR